MSHLSPTGVRIVRRPEEAWVSSEFSAQQYGLMARLVPGSQLAGYEIEEQVGAGGMAVVFRARDAVLGRLAALKVLSPALAADQDFRVRFLRESRAVASVEESHIIPVYGAGEVDGVLYIATKFVSGGDLADVLQRAAGPLEQGRTAAFIEQVAAALDAAHAAGLVHRDVKPGNVLVDAAPGRAEHAYLSDFGLSKPAMAATGLTATGTFLGTPDYCAPEQIRGLPVDGRADQYSLACMAFVLLAGDLPFHRQETMATLFAHLNDPVPPLARYRGDLPPGTDAVLARGLAKEPRDRYNRCGEFAAALRDSLAARRSAAAPRPSRPASAPPTEVWPPTAAQDTPPTQTSVVPSPASYGSAQSAAVPSPASYGSAPPAAFPSPAGQSPSWSASQAPAGGQPTWVAQPVQPGPTAPGLGPRPATPPPGRPHTTLPPKPPPAAGQGGKLPLVSKSAVIAALAAAAVLLLLFLLHGVG
jgi:serine/threonine protein kinase